MALTQEQQVHLECSGPHRLRKVAQNTTLYTSVTMVSSIKISPNLANSCISAARRGSVASMVVRAELMMETPVREMAPAALLTRTLPVRHVCGHKRIVLSGERNQNYFCC